MELNKQGFVKLTKANIKEMFDLCNQRYFDGQVKPPKLIQLFTPRRTTLAMVRPLFNKSTQQYSASLHFSNLYNWTVENMEKVMVHEMIHLSICDYLQPLRWWERIFPFTIKEHDSDFINMMNDLNQHYGLDIKVRFKEMRQYLKQKKTRK